MVGQPYTKGRLCPAIHDAKWFGTSPNHFGLARRTEVLWQAGQHMPYLKKVWIPKPLQRRYKFGLPP